MHGDRACRVLSGRRAVGDMPWLVKMVGKDIKPTSA